MLFVSLFFSSLFNSGFRRKLHIWHVKNSLKTSAVMLSFFKTNDEVHFCGGRGGGGGVGGGGCSFFLVLMLLFSFACFDFIYVCLLSNMQNMHS